MTPNQRFEIQNALSDLHSALHDADEYAAEVFASLYFARFDDSGAELPDGEYDADLFVQALNESGKRFDAEMTKIGGTAA